MTNEDLRKLDAEVHQKVMGGELYMPGTVNSPPYTIIAPIPYYSTEIAAAWLVVEKLTEQEYVKVHIGESHYHGASCSITAPHPSQQAPGGLVKRDALAVMGETAPLAICRAALKALEAK